MPTSDLNTSDLRRVFRAFSGPVSVTAITSATSVTLLVPREGYHLEIFHVAISAEDYDDLSAVGAVRLSDV